MMICAVLHERDNVEIYANRAEHVSAPNAESIDLCSLRLGRSTTHQKSVVSRAISCVSATPGQGPTACILPVLLQSRVKTWINGLLPAADDIKASLLSTPSASPYSEKS
ncbi:hypothetical protein WJX77_008586 [Trebouxia sp. C0004]